MHHELVRRFDAQVAATPDATAIEDGQRCLSYRQVANLSMSLARRLIDAGATPGEIMAIWSDRSIEWVVAMLAILRAGGVYMPLPPDLPRERRRLLVREAKVRHILRHPVVDDDLGDAGIVVGIELQPWPSCEDADRPIVPLPVPHADRACVLFTSGTTGTPKGVVVRQSSIAQLVVDTNYISFTPQDVVAFASNTGFDAVTFEVWGALLNGSRLVVIPTATLLTPSAFETAMRLHGITVLFLTTALFNRIARARPTACASLTWLIFGGEKADAECVRAVLENGRPSMRLIHAYGPTECTTFCLCHRVTDVPPDAGTVPIGAPITGFTIHLLDEQLRPVPDGEEGELCFAGTGVAEGYLHRPEETSAAFTSLRTADTEVRIYRTGDRARRREDGLIDYIGRRDGQIKLRGFRIEMAEVEAALTRHPAVRQAIVLVYAGPGATPRLGGCLLMNGSFTDRDIAGVRAVAAETLPEPMLPTRLRGYDAYPLTASQKVDRQRLLADLQHADGDPTQDDADAAHAPADAVEKRLVDLWRATLGHAPRHEDENFFDAGGDSLQAVDLQVRIENEWRIVLSPSVLIEAPTFRHLAQSIRQGTTPDVRPVVWLTHAPTRPALSCMPGLFGHVYFFRNLVPCWPTDWGLCALPSRYLDPSRDRRLLTLEEIAEENLERLQQSGVAPGEALAGYSFGGLVAYEMARRMAIGGKTPALILYDTAAEGEQFRGVSLTQRLRFLCGRILYGRLLHRGRSAPRALFSVAAANIAAVERYRPQPYPGDVLLIRSTVTGVPAGVNPETLGWDRLVRGRLTIRSVTVAHDAFFKPPHLAEVAALTIDYLRQHDLRRR